jgi:hypothetical protein
MYFDNFFDKLFVQNFISIFFSFLCKTFIFGLTARAPARGARKFDSPLRNSGRCNYVSTGRVPAHDSADRLVVGDFRKGNR